MLLHRASGEGGKERKSKEGADGESTNGHPPPVSAPRLPFSTQGYSHKGDSIRGNALQALKD